MGPTAKNSQTRKTGPTPSNFKFCPTPKPVLKKSKVSTNIKEEPSSRKPSWSNIEIDYNQVLGKGSYASVYKATIDYAEPLAIKVMDTTRSGCADYFRLEKEILSKLKHDAFPKLRNSLLSKGKGFLAMDFVEGTDLFQFLEERDHIDESETKNIFLQIIDGIQYCHDYNIAHRDLKLENILITKTGSIKIIDFGLSLKVTERPFFTKQFVGSPLYMAPEILNQNTYDPFLSDIWSLGVILYSIQNLACPWKSTQFEDLVDEVNLDCIAYPQNIFSLELSSLLRRILKLIPEKRISIFDMKNSSWFVSSAMDIE